MVFLAGCRIIRHALPDIAVYPAFSCRITGYPARLSVTAEYPSSDKPRPRCYEMLMFHKRQFHVSAARLIHLFMRQSGLGLLETNYLEAIRQFGRVKKKVRESETIRRSYIKLFDFMGPI